MSGLSLNGNSISIGQSGLRSINHYDGVVYFATGLPSTAVLSGNYAFKEFNVQLTDQPEYKLLFETKYVSNSKFNQTLSGLPPDTKITPAIFLNINAAENKPFAFNGIDNNTTNCRAVVIADNEFQRIAACNILKNLNLKPVKIITGLPFSYNGSFTGVNYNYDTALSDPSYYPVIMSSVVKKVAQRGEFANIARNCALVDIEISTPMSHG
jgi:hypothetical protein